MKEYKQYLARLAEEYATAKKAYNVRYHTFLLCLASFYAPSFDTVPGLVVLCSYVFYVNCCCVVTALLEEASAPKHSVTWM